MANRQAAGKGIYVIGDLSNGRAYVGSTLYLDKRLVRHARDLKNNCHHNQHLQNSFNAGHEFVVTPIPVQEDVDILDLEQKLIDEHNVDGKLYNIVTNVRYPSIGREVTEETKEKLRQANLGKKRSAESIEKTRQALIGNAYTLGRKQSPEEIAARVAAVTGQVRSAEAILNMKAGRRNSGSVSFSIDGKPYSCYTDASNEYSIAIQTVINRVESTTQRFEGWKRNE